jgi:hypothetical protein
VKPHRPRPSGPLPPARWRRLLNPNALGVLGLVALLAAITTTAPRWSRFLRQPLPLGDGESAPVSPLPQPAPTAPQGTIKVKLFFEAQEGGGLMLEEREVTFAGDLARQIEIVVEELLRGSQNGHLPPLPQETRVLGAFVTRAGVAYVNLSKEAQAGGAGSRSELLSVFALVDTLTSSFPAIRRVQILVEDRPADTLWGHVDLSRPLPPDLTLLAALDDEGAAGAGSGSPGAPAPEPAAGATPTAGATP